MVGYQYMARVRISTPVLISFIELKIFILIIAALFFRLRFTSFFYLLSRKQWLYDAIRTLNSFIWVFKLIYLKALESKLKRKMFVFAFGSLIIADSAYFVVKNALAISSKVTNIVASESGLPLRLFLFFFRRDLNGFLRFSVLLFHWGS